MARVSDMHKKWLKDPKYSKAYDGLQEEFALAGQVIEARRRAGLTQQQLARKMATTQPVIARLESGNIRPSLRTLERLAEATGSRLSISFQPRARTAKKQVSASSDFEVPLPRRQRARRTG